MDPWNTHRCLYMWFPSTSIPTSEEVLNRSWLFRFLRNKIYVYCLIKLSPSSDMTNRPLLVNPIFTSLHEDAPVWTLWIIRASSVTYLVYIQLHDKLHSSLFVQHSSMTYMASKSVMFAMLQKLLLYQTTFFISLSTFTDEQSPLKSLYSSTFIHQSTLIDMNDPPGKSVNSNSLAEELIGRRSSMLRLPQITSVQLF